MEVPLAAGEVHNIIIKVSEAHNLLNNTDYKPDKAHAKRGSNYPRWRHISQTILAQLKSNSTALKYGIWADYVNGKYIFYQK